MTRVFTCGLLLFVLSAVSLPAQKKSPPADVVPGKRSVIKFTESPMQCEADQVKIRLSAAEMPPAYDVSREEFEIIVPEKYDKQKPHGLFIWISAGGKPSIPKDWEPVLAEKDIIFVGARNSGNPRSIFDRIRLAIDANHNVRQRYNIDGRRVYLSGFSGGGRVASMAGVCWGEMFSGTLCFMGVNFYTDIEAENGKVYGMNFIPHDEILPLAKAHCRYALVTAEKDFNRANTRGVYENGYQKEGFKNVKLFEAPELGHKLPPAEWLKKALDFLDEGKPAAPVKR